MKKLISILVAFAMMASLAVTAAFALAPATAGQEVNDVTVKKTLKFPAGTATPNATFTFEVIEDTKNGSAAVPAIADQPIAFGSTSVQQDCTEGKQVEDTFDFDALVTEAFKIGRQDEVPNGQYAYVIKETQSVTPAKADNETYTFSGKVYRVRVYKSNDGITYTVTEVTNYGETNESEVKATGTSGQEAGKYEATLAFENTYVKTKVVDPDGDDGDKAGFAAEKYVDEKGNLYAGKDFNFNVKVTAPAINTLVNDETKDDYKPGYSYEVINVETGAVAKDADNNEKKGTIIPSATATTIALKTGERLVFTDLDIGAIVNINEADYAADFEQTAVFNNDTEGKYDAKTAKDYAVKETDSYLKVTNKDTKGSTEPEGILISNLPYIALALVAIGGLVAYVVIRRRNADEA